jgi:hypothetical protein
VCDFAPFHLAHLSTDDIDSGPDLSATCSSVPIVYYTILGPASYLQSRPRNNIDLSCLHLAARSAIPLQPYGTHTSCVTFVRNARCSHSWSSLAASKRANHVFAASSIVVEAVFQNSCPWWLQLLARLNKRTNDSYDFAYLCSTLHGPCTSVTYWAPCGPNGRR